MPLARSLSPHLHLFLAVLHIFLFFTFSLAYMHPSLSVLVTLPSFYLSPLKRRFPMRTFSISIFVLCPLSLSLSAPILCSLIPVPSTYTRLSLPRCSPSPSLVNSFCLFSSCIPFFVSPSRRNPFCPSRSCLLFLPLSFTALQFASTRTRVRDAYSRRVTRTQADTHARMHARTNARTHAHVCLMKSTNTSQYEWLVHASERDRVTRVHRVLSQI